MIIPFLKSFFRRHLCQDMAQVDVTIKIRSRLSSKTYLCFLHFFPSTYARSGLAVTDSVSNVSSQDQLAKSVYHTIIAQSVLCPTKKEEEKKKKEKKRKRRRTHCRCTDRQLIFYAQTTANVISERSSLFIKPRTLKVRFICRF